MDSKRYPFETRQENCVEFMRMLSSAAKNLYNGRRIKLSWKRAIIYGGREERVGNDPRVLLDGSDDRFLSGRMLSQRS